ncbi:MAG: glycosyltransferase, partial [Anaerolineales bacterium]|nr:glycosyltransferase [Anaerolineales bacterium]
PPAGLNDARQPLKAAMVANFRPQKDHNLLLQALARAPRARENLHVYLAGFDGDPEYMADCLKLVEALDLEANVTFLGGRTDVPAILKAADIGLLSSRSETGPLVLLEYMAAGLPFIATHTGHVAEKVAGEGLPFFSEPGDIRSYAENLEAIVALPAGDRAALGEIGQELVRHEFDLRQKAGAFIRLYQEILDPSEELHTPNRVLHSSSSERIEQPKDRAFLAEDRIV